MPILERRLAEVVWSRCGYEGPDGNIYLYTESACDSAGEQTWRTMDPETCEEIVQTNQTGHCCPSGTYYSGPEGPTSALRRTWDWAGSYEAPDENPDWNPPFPNPNGDLTVTGAVVMVNRIKVFGDEGPGELCEEQITFEQNDPIVSISNLYGYTGVWDPPEDAGTRPPDSFYVSFHERYTQTWVKTGMSGGLPVGTATAYYENITDGTGPTLAWEFYDVAISGAVYNGAGASGLPTMPTEEYFGSIPYSLATYESPNTDEIFAAAAIASLPPFSADEWSSRSPLLYSPYSERDLSGDENMIGLRFEEFRFRFPVPRVGMGNKYSVTWMEQTIPRGGRPLHSIEIAPPLVGELNVFRPGVTLSAVGSGTGAQLVAVMGADGSLASIRVLNPGSGYTAPVVEIENVWWNHTTSTGWAANVENGQIISVTRSGGSAGNFLPQLLVQWNDVAPARQATCTCTVNERGEIDSITLTDTGAGYTYPPSIYVDASPARYIRDLVPHFAPENEQVRCLDWSGVTPEGYDPEDSETWPVLTPSRVLESPGTSGIIIATNIRWNCRAGCPA